MEAHAIPRRGRRLGQALLAAVPLALTLSVLISAAAAATTVTSAEAYSPGDLVWEGSAPIVILSTGCTRVPQTGYLGQNATAQTSAKYSSFWSWDAGSASGLYRWWVYRSDGLLKGSGTTSGPGSLSTGAANHYWRVQNISSTPQAWNVCWSG